jgi:predicted Zn-dependent protease
MAQPSDVKKVINKFDAPYLRKASSLRIPTDFWNTIIANDKNVAKYNNAVKKNDKTLNAAYNALVVYDNQTQTYEYITTEYNDIVERLVYDLGIGELTYKKPVKVIMDETINASMDYTGQMRINKGCFIYLTYKELLAVCAHEMAHYACAHVITSVWKVAKKQKTNRAWASLGTALTVGMVAGASMYGGSNGVDVSHLNDFIANSDILLGAAYADADHATLKFKYRYSRGEESEADIIAYRFMERMGYGGENVLSMLRKLKDLYGDTPAGKYDNHPSTLFRIQVISAMMSGVCGK